MHNGTLLIPSDTKMLVIDPAVLATTKKPIIHQGTSICWNEQSVLVQKLHPDSGQTDRFNIALTHTQTDARQTVTQVFNDIQIANPEAVLLQQEFYYSTKASLFPKDNSPSMREISQGGVGSCALLSAIQGILNHPDGAAFIRGMMKRTKDGRVVVRLFDPQTAKPVYISVPSAILHGDNRAGHHEALWVYVLENAFIAFGKKPPLMVDERLSNTRDAFPWHGTVFDTTDALTYMVLTGRLLDNRLSRKFKMHVSESIPEDSRYLDALQVALEQGKFICCASLGPRVPLAGLHKRHGYTLLAILQKEENGQQAYYIRLRNPHGAKAWYERFFDSHYSGVFEIKAELFFQHFNEIAVIESAGRVFRLEQERLRKLQNIARTGRVHSFRITRETPPDQFGALETVYQDFVTRLLELELVQVEQLFIESAITRIKEQFFADHMAEQFVSTSHDINAEQEPFVSRAVNSLIHFVYSAAQADGTVRPNRSHSDNVINSLRKLSSSPIEEATLARVYDILKLDWFIHHRSATFEAEIERLQEKIVESSGYDFSSRMHIEYRKLKALSTAHRNAGQDGEIVIDEANQALFDLATAEQEAVANRVNYAFYLECLYTGIILTTLVCCVLLLAMSVSFSAQCLIMGGTIAVVVIVGAALEYSADHPERPLVSEDINPEMSLSI